MSLDIVLLLTLLIQWRLAVIAWRRIRLLPPGRRAAARAAMVFFGVLVAAGYACNLAPVTASLPMSANIAPALGAVTLGYVLASAAALLFLTLHGFLGKHMDLEADPVRRRVLKLAGSAAVASPFAVLSYAALVNRTDFEIKEVEIPLAGLAADLDGFRVLHLSDIHLSAFLSEAEFARMIDAVCELRPHIAFATGDFISNFGDPMEACMRQLARVKADAGLFGCLGNHEHYARAVDSAIALGARAGIPVLRGEARRLRFGKATVNLAGVDYQPMFRKEQYLRGAEQLLCPEALNILLSHNPDVFPVAARQGYDLVLAGHTHGGQVNVEIFDRAINPARFFTPYVQGLYREGRSAIYVTRGIGTVGIPARIGAPPEISLLRLRKA